MKTLRLLLSVLVITLSALILQSSKPIPKGAVPVKPFDLKKYLGTWYEIARMDYKYEKNLNNVTATYSLKENGDIEVDNKGYDYKKEKWEQSIGKARPVDDPTEGRLKVSFFGPFYSEYNVIALDDYQYALVAGESTDYLWILSRQTTIREEIKQKYLKLAAEVGYPTDKLVWVEHGKK